MVILQGKSRVKGFTLITVIFALAILAIGILSILSLFPLGHKAVNRSKTMTISALIAEKELNRIRGLYSAFDSPDPPEEMSGFEPDFPKFSWKAIISGKEIYTVELEVSWEEERKKKYEFFTTEFTKH